MEDSFQVSTTANLHAAVPVEKAEPLFLTGNPAQRDRAVTNEDVVGNPLL